MAKTEDASPPDKPAKSASPARVAAFRTGLSAEARAAAWLTAKGYRILAQRFRTPYGEIDIVARRRNLLAFIEVKARANPHQKRPQCGRTRPPPAHPRHS